MSMSQAVLAERAGVSRKWVYEFEAGKPTAELALVLKVLDALDIELNLVERERLGEEPELTDTELALTKALERSAAPSMAATRTNSRADDSRPGEVSREPADQER